MRKIFWDSFINFKKGRKLFLVFIFPFFLFVFLFLIFPPIFISAENLPGNPYGEAWLCQPVDGKWSCSGLVHSPSSHVNLQEAIFEKDQILGWIPDNSDSDSSNSDNCSLCGGHYYEPHFDNLSQEEPLDQSVSQVLSNQKKYTLGGDVELNGNVKILQPGREMTADHVTLYPNDDDSDDSNKLERIQAHGDVRIRQPGEMLYAQTLKANLYTYQATLTNAYYLLKVQTDWANSANNTSPPNFTGYAQGQAAVLHQLSQTLFQFDHATYTTATPDDDTWHFYASKIVLNKMTERGYADNAVLYIQRVPVFYFPYFSFPLSKERQTGFLYGDFSSSGSSGFTVSAPYYLNLAPNYDDTVTPTWLMRRGVMMDNNFRYLTSNTSGVLNTNYLPDDQEAHMSRWLVNYTQSTQLSNFWHMGVNYNDVSDPNYFSDLETNSAQISNQSYLDREINLTSNNNNWAAAAYIRDYKIVDQDLDLGNRPYNTEPELDFSTQTSNFAGGKLNLSLSSQLTNFEKDDLTDEPGPIEGGRVSIRPTISAPLTQSYGYFTPSLGAQGTAYSLSNSAQNGFSQAQPSMIDPILDLDTGLNFDRSFGVLNKNYEQTLTPRLFYLYVPYRDQNNFPSFDSSIIQFNYDSLFATNRFNGLDRQGDANQLSYALSTSFNNDSGSELLDAGIGQTAYFQDRRVSLCQSTPANNCLPNENPDYDQAFSDIAAQANIWLTTALKLHYDFTFDQTNHMFDTQTYQLQYLPDPHHIFNIGFGSNRTDYSLLSNEQLLEGVPPPMLAQLTTSFLWQLTPLWNLIGSWNYSTNQKRTIDSYGGIEYSPCSWAVRLIWHRYLLNQDVNDPNGLDGPSTSSVAIQFQLKGLGNVGSSKIQYLARQIPGYQPGSNGSGFSP